MAYGLSTSPETPKEIADLFLMKGIFENPLVYHWFPFKFWPAFFWSLISGGIYIRENIRSWCIKFPFKPPKLLSFVGELQQLGRVDTGKGVEYIFGGMYP